MEDDPLRWAWKDGDIDMILHFKTQELVIDPVDTYGVLLGETFVGLTLGGYDTINVLGAKRPGHFYEVWLRARIINLITKV